MIYQKVTSSSQKWFFLCRYDTLEKGIEIWSARTLKWTYFNAHQSNNLLQILLDHEICQEISEQEVNDIIDKHII